MSNVVDSVQDDRNPKNFHENVDIKALDQENDRKMYEKLQEDERHTFDIGDKISDITLPEKEVDTDIQLDKQFIEPLLTSEEEGVTQSKTKSVQNITSPLNKPIPKQSQDIAQPQKSSEISVLERFNTQDKVITTIHVKCGEILKLKAMNREGIWDICKKIPPYADSLCRPHPRPPDIPLLNISKKLLNLDMDLNHSDMRN